MIRPATCDLRRGDIKKKIVKKVAEIFGELKYFSYLCSVKGRETLTAKNKNNN